MDDYRQKLENRYEEAEFELLFDDYLTDLGEACQKEFEQAKARGEITDMPPEMKKQLLRFIENYNPVEEKKPRHVSIIRYFLVAAIACTVLLISLVTVQAMGIDVFGEIGNWTDSVFHFHNSTKETIAVSETVSPSLIGLQSVFEENNIPKELAPTWIPDSFILSSLIVSSNNSIKTVTSEYLCEEDIILYQLSVFPPSINDDPFWIEKDEKTPELYHSGDRDYYIFTNLQNWIGVWQGIIDNETYNIYIQVPSSREDLISMIDSIGGMEND